MSRRLFLHRLGHSALGVMVVGTVPACAGAGDAGRTGAPAAGDASPAVSPGAASSGAPSGGPAAAAVEWRRVDLDFVSAYIVVRDGDVAIVDTGVAGSEGAIEEAMAELDLLWADVGHVILTHRHPDHVGSAVAVLERAAGATGYAGPGDADVIGAHRPVTVVRDGDTVFGLTVVATPGHTEGHICLLDEVGGLLLAGDALTGGDDGSVAGPDPQFTADMARAHASVRKLAGLTFETAVFGHGEPVVHDADAAVARLADRLPHVSPSAPPST